LRRQQRHVPDRSRIVLPPNQLEAVLGGIHGICVDPERFGVVVECGQRIGHILEGVENGQPVLRARLIVGINGSAQLGPQSASLKDRSGQTGRKIPDPRAWLEETVKYQGLLQGRRGIVDGGLRRDWVQASEDLPPAGQGPQVQLALRRCGPLLPHSQWACHCVH
jgi:hypothetical protein